MENTYLNKVSILVPAYNSERFITETIKSCLIQTYSNIEIIIVDDGSTDSTLKIAQEFEIQDKRIKVYNQNKLGACAARNLAFEKSSGYYILYLDADDILSPNKIELQIKELLNKKCDISITRWCRYYSQDKYDSLEPVLCAQYYDRGIDLLLDLWKNGEMFQTSCYLTPRHIIEKSGKWNENLLKNQDGEFFARVLTKAKNIRVCEDACVFYRTGEYESVSKANSSKKIEALLYSFELYEMNVLSIEDSKRVREGLATNYALFRYLYNDIEASLSNKARMHINNLKVKHPCVGTPKAKMVQKLIGFENFLRLRTFISKLKS